MKGYMTRMVLCSVMLLPGQLWAQSTGDYRTRGNGNWSQLSVWERYTGTTWAPATSAPTGAETITVQSSDSVFVDAPITITGRLINQGIVHAEEGMLTIGDGGVYQHDRDGGKIPVATWNEGATLHLTGIATQAPANRNQAYYHIVFDTPHLSSNLNLGLDDVTIRGNIWVKNTGSARWYLTTAASYDTSVVTINGDVYVEAGHFAVHGTSNAYTTFIVHHYGSIIVTGGNFSISRGSQPGGITTWYLYAGDFSFANATTQSSTATLGGAKFVFAKQGTQRLTIGEGSNLQALPVEVLEGATLDLGESRLAGTGIFYLHAGATLGTALPGGVAAIFENVTGQVTLEEESSYAFNGSEPQETSILMPTVVGDLIIDNPAGVKLSQETTINGVLRLKAGVLDNTIPFTLGPNGTISYEGGSLLHPVANEPLGLPLRFTLYEGYPNPFKQATTIRYDVAAPHRVIIKVYDLTGRVVAELVNQEHKPGTYSVQWHPEGLASGIYYCRIEAGAFQAVRKLVLMK